MKKTLLYLVVTTFVVVFTSSLFAGDEQLFELDEQVIATQMADLNELEAFVANNNGITLTQLRMQNNGLATHLSSNALNAIASFSGEPVLGIPSFIWGCVFGVAGLAVTYFVTEDKEETKKALWGCITGTVVSVLFYILFWAALFTTSASTI